MGKAHRLSALAVEKLKSPGTYSDGAGLVVKVSDTGAKSYMLRYMVNGRARWMGLGPCLDVSLTEARELASIARKKIRAGVDPIDERKAEKEAKKVFKLKSMTFGECSAAYIEAKRSDWSNPKHAMQWTNTLTTYCAKINTLPVAAIDTGLVMSCLEPIWKTKPETASRLRGRMEKVLDWATVRNYRQGDNPAAWKNHLDTLLAQQSKSARVVHHAALDYREIGAFMVDLRKQAGTGARALEFGILCASRSGEIRGATWSEIDLVAGTWTIPKERMKMDKEHKVPLSDAAITLLKSLDRVDGNELVFPAPRGGVLSDMTLGAVLKRMGVEVTQHGFRSTFRDWAAECTNYPREVAEMALAHGIGDKVEAAYRRGDLFEKRTRMMQDWSKFCAKVLTGANVMPLRDTA